MTDAFPYKMPWLDAMSIGGWSFNTFALNQTTDQVEFIFQAHDAISLARGAFRYGTRTGTPPTYIISIQGVDGSGNPDGTVKGGGSAVSKTFTPPADTTWNSLVKWQTFDNAYTTTRGEWLAMVIAYSSGSVDASNLSTFTVDTSNLGGLSASPYVISNNAGSRSRNNNGQPIFGYGTSGAAYGWPIQAEVAQNFTSTSEYGNVFTFPAGWGTSFKIVGVRILGSPPTASSYTLNLYDGGAAGNTTVLQNVTVDGDYTASGNRPQIIYFDESTLSTLLFGNAYRLSLVGTGAVSSTIRGMDVAANGDLNAFGVGGINNYSSTRSGGNWTDTNTRRFHIEPIVADITGGGGSTGGATILGSSMIRGI